MIRARLMLGEKEVTFTRSGHVICGLALRWEGVAFPHPDWSDFAVVVLSWWADAARDLLAGRGSTEVRFMDGPYSVAVERTNTGVWRLQCVETGREPLVRHDVLVEPGHLAESILHAGTRVLEVSGARGLRDSDAPRLTAALSALRAQRARTPA